MLDIYFLPTNIIEVHFLRRKKKKTVKWTTEKRRFSILLLISRRHQLYCKRFFNVCEKAITMCSWLLPRQVRPSPV